MSRTYKCAPLPFMGQKRYFLRDFAEVLERVEGQIDTVVDFSEAPGCCRTRPKGCCRGAG